MANRSADRESGGLPGWLPYALGGLVFLAGLLAALLPWGTLIPWLSVSLHSLLSADYSADLDAQRLPPVRLALAAEAMADQGYTLGTSIPGDYLATVQTNLLTPIPTVTPRPGETLLPLTTPPFSPTPLSPTPALLPTATPTPIWAVTPTFTLTATTALNQTRQPPMSTARFTLAPTRRPTNPPVQPTRTPTPKPTDLPATATPHHTSVPPTRTLRPTATNDPYPPPPYP